MGLPLHCLLLVLNIGKLALFKIRLLCLRVSRKQKGITSLTSFLEVGMACYRLRKM